MNSALRKFYQRNIVQIFVAAVLVTAIVSCFWCGLQLVFCASPPLTYVSGSYMDVNSDMPNYAGYDLFGQTLCAGDAVLIEGVLPEEVNSDYPDSDIIVFRNPDSPKELSILRVLAKERIDGKWYFFVKGDGVGSLKWPAEVDSAYYARWNNQNASLPSGAVCEDLVVGKFVLRLPLVGSVAVFLHNLFGVDDSFVVLVVPLIFVLFVLVVVWDFVLPVFRGRRLQVVGHKRRVGVR